MIIVLFSTWVYLWKMDTTKRSKKPHELRSLTDPFEPEAWYYEFGLIARRISLSILGTISYLDTSMVRFSMIIIALFALWAQSWLNPFRADFNDVLELTCLFCFIAVLSAVFSVDLLATNADVVSVLASVLIALPFVIFLSYALYLCVPKASVVAASARTIVRNSSASGRSYEQSSAKEVNSDPESTFNMNDAYESEDMAVRRPLRGREHAKSMSGTSAVQLVSRVTSRGFSDEDSSEDSNAGMLVVTTATQRAAAPVITSAVVYVQEDEKEDSAASAGSAVSAKSVSETGIISVNCENEGSEESGFEREGSVGSVQESILADNHELNVMLADNVLNQMEEYSETDQTLRGENESVESGEMEIID